MPAKTKVKKSRKQRHHTKISQKVIQKVVVKIGEERKAKRARRRQRRVNKQDYEQQQQSQSVPATVVYNTGGAYLPQTPQFAPAIIKPQAVRQTPQFVEIEQPSGIADVPTRREQLETFITPVEPAETVTSRMYSQRVFNGRVEGNYAFGEKDAYSEPPPSSLYDNETQLRNPRNPPQSLSEYLLTQKSGDNPTEILAGIKNLKPYDIRDMESLSEISGSEQVAPTQVGKAKRRTKHEIANARYTELQALYEAGGVSTETAYRLANDVKAADLPAEIKRTKAENKARGKKPK